MPTYRAHDAKRNGSHHQQRLQVASERNGEQRVKRGEHQPHGGAQRGEVVGGVLLSAAHAHFEPRPSVAERWEHLFLQGGDYLINRLVFFMLNNKSLYC